MEFFFGGVRAGHDSLRLRPSWDMGILRQTDQRSNNVPVIRGWARGNLPQERGLQAAGREILVNQRVWRDYSARLVPAGPPLRAFAATAACSRAAPARPSLTARASNLARGLAKLSNSRAACGGGREFEPARPQGMRRGHDPGC